MLAFLLSISLIAAQPASGGEVLADIRVQGNVLTPDDEVRRLAAVEIGTPIAADTASVVAERLRSTRRFERVEVLKRFASIADPTQVVLVIIVDEGPVSVEMTGDPDNPTRVVRSHGPNLMVLPVLNYADGYGFTYGARLAVADPVGSHSRLSFPLTWGGERRAAAELDKQFDRGPIGRLEAGVGISERENPYYEADDTRGRVWARAERLLAPGFRVGASGGWQHVSFQGMDDSFGQIGADAVYDTRLDPFLARNAVYGRAAWEYLDFHSGGTNSRSELEGRGYVGLLGQSVLVLRGQRQDAARPLPAYLQPLLGGFDNLRGFAAGAAVGDTLVAGSAELRVPLTSPLSIGKIGVSAFADAGAAYDTGQLLADQRIKQGYGGCVWLTAAIVRLDLAIGHGVGGSTHVNFAANVSF